MARISLRDISKCFEGTVQAAKHVSLEVNAGEFMVIVGPSGSGKTTLLRIIAGLEEPDAGQVLFDGREMTSVDPGDRDTAMVFQEGNLYPHMSVYDNLAFGLKVRKQPKTEIDEAIQQTAEILGIGDLLKRRPATLSAGQRGRAALGRAIVRKPAVFLFDEPLANLDAELREQMRTELKGLHRRLGITTVYVTHDQLEAMALGDQVCVLQDGTVQQTGTGTEVYGRPANHFVAGFFGAPRMNFLTGHIESNDSQAYFVSDDLRLELPQHLQQPAGVHTKPAAILGIRPEDLRPAGAIDSPSPSIQATVWLVESLGAQTHVIARTRAGTSLTYLIGSDRSAALGQAVHLSLDPDRIHLFEAGPLGRNLAL